MSFRLVLAVIALLVLACTVWMGMHVSSDPVLLGRWSIEFGAVMGAMALITVVTTLAAGPFYGRVRGYAENIALLIVATAMSLAVAESIVRLVDLFGISYYADVASYHRAKVPDRDLYYVHKPNSAASFRNFDVRINALGMRGRDIVDKVPGELRILFLGDSVTFGWGVGEDETFSVGVERRLEERLNRPIQSLNSGVGSYNTENQMAFLRRHGPLLAPDVVALIYNGNDINRTPNVPFDPLAGQRPNRMSPPETAMWILGKSWIYRLGYHFWEYGGGVEAGQMSVIDSVGWQESDSALAAINNWCLENDVPFVTFVYWITPDPLTAALLPRLQKVGSDHDFKVIDVLPWFADEEPRELINSVVDGHPNAIGHAIVADGIADVIEEMDLQKELTTPR